MSAVKKVAGGESEAQGKESPSMKFLGKGKKEDAPVESTPGTPVEKTAEAATETKTSAKKAKAPEVLNENDLINEVSYKLENLTEAEAFKTAHDLIDTAEFNDFRLGGVLSVIQSHGWWEGKGFANFKEFITGEFGMPYRKAMYLVTIYNGLVESGVPYEKVKSLGWTKLKELATIITKENVDEWVEKASAMTVLQLIDAIKAQAKGEGGNTLPPGEGETSTTTTLTFKVHADQKETIRTAIDKAKADFGTEFDSVALEQMSMAYLEKGTGKAKNGGASIEDQMKTIGWEEALNVFDKLFPNINITVEEGPEPEAPAEGLEGQL